MKIGDSPIKDNSWEKGGFKDQWYTRLAFPEVDSDKLEKDVQLLLAKQREEVVEDMEKLFIKTLNKGIEDGNSLEEIKEAFSHQKDKE